MHTIQAARLKPGVKTIPTAPDEAVRGTAATVRGTALIFWDLKIPGKKKKLDAIDTDQITPAKDCVSESLDTLDERWKAGSFRYLMPDFRARVHAGETFVIAFDPASRRLVNETRNKKYDPLPLTSKEDEIRRSGGIFTIGRREFAASTRRS